MVDKVVNITFALAGVGVFAWFAGSPWALLMVVPVIGLCLWAEYFDRKDEQ